MRRQQWQSNPYEGERQQSRNQPSGRRGMAGEEDYGRDYGPRRGGGSEDYDSDESFGGYRQSGQRSEEYGSGQGGGQYGRGEFGSRRGGGYTDWQEGNGGPYGGRGRQQGMEQPGGRPRYRDENEPPYGGPDFDSDPFAGEQRLGEQSGRYGGVRDFDESPFEQGGAPRRGFGRGGQISSQQRSQHRGQQGHWGSEQGDLSSTLSSGSQTFGLGAGGQQWGDMERGRQGPRGYARSDERIREFICERLAQHHQLEVSDVSVDVKDGCVVLEGTVPDRRMKHQIEDTADNCWGVKDVENHIRVQSKSGNGGQQGSEGSFGTQGSQGTQGTQGSSGKQPTHIGQGSQSGQGSQGAYGSSGTQTTQGTGTQGSQSPQHGSQREHGSGESEQGSQSGRATTADPKATGSSGRKS